MTLTAGTRIGPYEIVSPLGAGGMGEVYRARDTRLGRDIAVKILPELFATDPERVARFQREAQLLASLNHPNIAIIHGLEESSEGRALVMELVEGPTLADKIAQGPVPLDEALPVARQIAEALEAAHDRGVVHRDLKPANIKLTSDGKVKVLDFGLAKLVETGGAGEAGGVGGLTMSPTLSVQATDAGVILGTAAYMSPEQARGKPVDRRADIWAFGCVLFEMLTGKQAFDAGETVSDAVASILKGEPDWKALPQETPNHIRALLRRCLQKDPQKRLPHIGVARIEIDEGPEGRAESTAIGKESRSRRERVAWIATALCFVALIATLAVVLQGSRTPSPAPEAVRFTISAPPDAAFAGGFASAPSPSISPDGRRIVFRAQRRDTPDMLWVRALDSTVARPLPGTEGADFPFWSPDSQYVGFFAEGRLKTIEASGGVVQVICDAPSSEGGTWNRDGVILFAATGTSGLSRVSARGGTPVPVTVLDDTRSPREASHRWPHFLPDGQHFVFRAQPSNDIRLGSLDSMQTARLLSADSKALYAAPGYLLFLRQGTLLAQRFDPATLELIGDGVPIAEQVRGNPGNARSAFSVSDNGVLTYRAGLLISRVTVFDRAGRQLRSVSDGGDYRAVSLSPDGTRALVHRHDDGAAGGGLWLIDLVRGTTSRFTFGRSHESVGMWSADGQYIIYNSGADGEDHLYRKLASGVGAPESLLSAKGSLTLTDWSRDGRYLLYVTDGGKTRTDVWMLPLFGDRKPVPFVAGEFDEDQAVFSPDGRWIAYASNETGRSEVYVQPFPVSGGKWQVSTMGGVQPRWAPDGKQLYYLGPSGAEWTVMTAGVRTAAAGFDASVPAPLFTARMSQTSPTLSAVAVKWSYSLARDGNQFVMLTSVDDETAAQLDVVINWPALLTRR